MKEIENDKKEWQRLVAAAKKAQYMVQTGVSGTRNFLVATLGDDTIVVDAFDADERRHQQAFGGYTGYQVLAYGNDFTGEAVLVNMTDGTMKIFGKGRRSGTLTLIQEYQETYTIVRIDDRNPKEKRYVKIVGTADEVLVSIIVDLLRESIPDTEDNQKMIDFILSALFENDEQEQTDESKEGEGVA